MSLNCQRLASQSIERNFFGSEIKGREINQNPSRREASQNDLDGGSNVHRLSNYGIWLVRIERMVG